MTAGDVQNEKSEPRPEQSLPQKMNEPKMDPSDDRETI